MEGVGIILIWAAFRIECTSSKLWGGILTALTWVARFDGQLHISFLRLTEQLWADTYVTVTVFFSKL
jgi:hypothetical protein